MSQSEIAVSTTPPLPGTVLVEQINDAFQAVATQFSGSVDPAANAGAYMLWADTGTGKLKRRNAANSAWTEIGDLFPASSGGTGATTIAVGTTAQRPATPTAGMIRQNSTTGNPEWYDATTSSWKLFNQTSGYTINYLLVGGGAGAANGGGGGGEVKQDSYSASPGAVRTITIGAGGASATNGSSSIISGVATCVGGGAGGTYPYGVGQNGASGGGGAGGANDGGSLTNGGAATAPFGFAGGKGNNSSYGGGGGGGGAGSAGGNSSGSYSAGAAGAGLTSTITGAAVAYAAGGRGSTGLITSDAAPAANTGNGGLGENNVKNGGSGCAVLSIPTSQYTGTYTGTVVVSVVGSNTILKYSSNGTYTE